MAVRKTKDDPCAIKVLHESPTKTASYSCSCGQVVEYKGNVFSVYINVHNGASSYNVNVRTKNGDWASVTPPMGVSGVDPINYVAGDTEKRRLMKKDMEALKRYILDVY